MRMFTMKGSDVVRGQPESGPCESVEESGLPRCFGVE
jgi:hypothetical protein